MLGREMGGLAEQIGLVSGGRRFAWAIPYPPPCAFDFEVKALAAVLKVEASWLLGITPRKPKRTS